MTIKVATLLVKSGGKITHPTTASQNRPGRINIEASAGPPTTRRRGKGGQITVGGGAGLPNPFINIIAVGHILIDGLLDAKSTTAGARADTSSSNRRRARSPSGRPEFFRLTPRIRADRISRSRPARDRDLWLGECAVEDQWGRDPSLLA